MNKLMPASLPPLPEGAVYLGRGQQFERTRISFQGWILTQNNKWYLSFWAGRNPNKHYAAPAGSDIVRLNQSGEEKEQPKMYTIHSDGSATYQGSNLNSHQVLRLVEHHEAILDSLRDNQIGGFTTETIIKEFRVGCRFIPPKVMADFIRDYREGKWKRPQTFAIGQRFRRTERGSRYDGNIYILCHIGDYRVGLINIETGNLRCVPTESIADYDPKRIPADQIPGYKPGSRFWEILDE